MRTFVIGDIHGGLKALDQLIQKLELQADDRLIFVGDYVDGWSESAQVIDRLLELDTAYACIFIKGNHDEWCEAWLRTGDKDLTWFMHGGKETIESYENYSEGKKFIHLEFFERMKDFVIDEGRLYIHAGFTSMHGPEQEHHKSNFGWDRTLWEVALAVHPDLDFDSIRYPARLKQFNEIYIGHTPTTKYDESRPMNEANVWNVDTGAAFKGALSAIEIGSKGIYQSDEVWTLYPDEKGRNKE